MSTVFRHSKRSTYYHRSYVPKALRQLLNERFEIWRSLDTLDKDEATVRGAFWGCPCHKTIYDAENIRPSNDARSDRPTRGTLVGYRT
jgi:hypothetical protein